MNVLSPVRTSWEKATLLHMEYHRREARPTAERLARHYYDVALLADHEIGRDALNGLAMLERVANDKKRLFRSGWANYDQARPGTLRLVPSQARLALLSSAKRPAAARTGCGGPGRDGASGAALCHRRNLCGPRGAQDMFEIVRKCQVKVGKST